MRKRRSCRVVLSPVSHTPSGWAARGLRLLTAWGCAGQAGLIRIFFRNFEKEWPKTYM
jgi:hypothetical protein